MVLQFDPYDLPGYAGRLDRLNAERAVAFEAPDVNDLRRF
jgi:hypothetical protein